MTSLWNISSGKAILLNRKKAVYKKRETAGTVINGEQKNGCTETGASAQRIRLQVSVCRRFLLNNMICAVYR